MEKTLLTSTLKTARIIFFAILFQATVFSFWGLQYFISQPGPTQAPIAVYVVFTLMALVSFIYGIRFFQNYTKVKGTQLRGYPEKKRKESLLLVFAIHVLLLEFISIIGIMMAIFTQTNWLIYPFYVLFAIGMWFSYPKLSWFDSYFSSGEVV